MSAPETPTHVYEVTVLVDPISFVVEAANSDEATQKAGAQITSGVARPIVTMEVRKVEPL